MQPTLRVIHVDDDPFELDRIKKALETNPVEASFFVECFPDAEFFLDRIKHASRPDVVILDINLGEEQPSGTDLAKACRNRFPETVILICSNEDDVKTISECLNGGADDFISKKSDRGELSLRVFNSWKLARLKQGSSTSEKSGKTEADRSIAGATMERIAKRVPLLVGSAVTAIAVRGESGTGKEVVADLFRAALPKQTPFVKVNCGAISPSLLESELFGHVRGAFTGALVDKRGLLEAASGGWIFLDEVATLSLSAQVALLSVLETQEVLRVGSTKPVPIFIRVISATNESIEDLIKAGKFRKDLWQRLREAEIELPPLRERRGEIESLVQHFCKTMTGGPYSVSGPVVEVLSKLPWKEGNVRELRNCLRAMTELHVNRLLTPLALPHWVWEQLGPESSTETSNDSALSTGGMGGLVVPLDPDGSLDFDELSDKLLLEVLRKLAANHRRLSFRSIAKTINMSRSTLSTRIKGIAHRNLATTSELAGIVNITDKSGES